MLEEMKEDIGKVIDKNIENNFTFEKNAFKNNQYCLADGIWNILGKYNNQDIMVNISRKYGKTYITELEKYKNAWEESKIILEMDKDELSYEDIKELEQKHGIGRNKQ